MSNQGGKGEQIVARLFGKVALLISDARITNREVGAPARVDKWFQLEVRDDGRSGSLVQELKELAGESDGGPIELRARTVLLLPHLAPQSAQALVLLSESNTTPTRRTQVNMPPSARGILLEEWSVTLDRANDFTLPAEDPYPGIYKQAIALMRSLFALLRYVPTWHLHRKLGSNPAMQMVVVTFTTPEPLDEAILGFEHKLVPNEPDPTSFAFPPIATPLGSVTLRVNYRPHVRFRLDPLENLLSSQFASGPPSPGTQAAVQRLGIGSTSPASPSPPAPAVNPDQLAFTPTLLANRQRASLTGSGSPLRPSSTRPSTGPSTTPTLAVGPGVPAIRPRTVSTLSTGGESSSPRRTVYDLLQKSPPPSPRLGTIEAGVATGASGLSRTRTQSLLSAGIRSGSNAPSTPFGGTGGTGTGLVLGGVASGDNPPPSPARRTPSGINAFKSATLASSPRTLGTGSPRTTPGLGLGTPPRSGLGPGTAGGSDGRRSLDSGDRTSETGAQPQPIKRYDSSFGHRTGRSHGSVGSGSGAGGVGSTGIPGSLGRPGSLGAGGSGGGGSVGGASIGSGGTGEQHRRLTTIGSQSYESQLAEDEELGQYIAEIDTRPQLGLDVSGTGRCAEGTGGTEQFPLSSPVQERLPLGSPRPGPLPLTSSPRPGPLPLGGSPRTLSSHRRMSSMDSDPTRAERFPPSSLPARYSALPDVSRSPLSPDAPRPLPPALQSVPPSPAESAWPSRFRDRSRSRDRGSGSRTRGFGESVLAPLHEGDLGERVRTMSLADRPIRERTSSLTPSTHERQRTSSFARLNRTMLTNPADVDAALQLQTALFNASYAPPSPSGPGTPLAESGRRQIGNDEIVGRLELGGSGSVGSGARGSMRPGRDTDTWRDGGEWDQRMGGWR